MQIFVLMLACGYAAFVLLILTGILILLKQNKPANYGKLPYITVLVAFRNEASHLPRLLEDLSNQRYPYNRLEVLLINDHSNDAWESIVTDFTRHKFLNFRLINLPDGFFGKKQALQLGIKHAVGEFILSLDADCRLSENWAVSMISTLINNNADMVPGPVVLSGKGIPASLQAAESLSLLAITMGSAGLGIPVLSNGANMLTKKSELMKLQDPYILSVSSGDDILLMEQFKRLKKKIIFNLSPTALVKSYACSSWQKLIHQRARWMRKSKHYPFGSSKFTAGLFGLLQLTYLISVPLLILADKIFLLLLLWGFKLIYDIIAMWIAARLVKSSFHFFPAMGMSLLYPLWTIVSTILSCFIKPYWKDRPAID